MKKLNSIMLFSNGNIGVFGNDEQVPELQENPINRILNKAGEFGFIVDESTEILLPFGLKAKVIIYIIGGKKKYNYQVVE